MLRPQWRGATDALGRSGDDQVGLWIPLGDDVDDDGAREEVAIMDKLRYERPVLLDLEDVAGGKGGPMDEGNPLDQAEEDPEA